MNIKKIIFLSILFAILTISAVSATQDINDNLSLESEDINNLDIITEEIDDGDEDDDENDSYSEVNIEIPSEVEIGSGDVVEIQLPDDAKGEIKLYIDSKLYNTTAVDGNDENLITLSLDFLSCKQHLINVSFISSTSKYGNVSNQTLINVTYNITITLEEDSYIYGKQGNKVYITAPQDILLKIEVEIDNKKYNLTKETNTMAYVDISDFEGGSYIITASYAGDETYLKYSTKETINIISAIDTPSLDVGYNSNQYVTLKIPGLAKGNLTLTVNGVKINSVNFTNGEAKIKFPTSKVGRYYYNVTYDGDDYEIESIMNNIIQIHPKVNIPSQMTVGENKYITFDINEDAIGDFEIEVDGDNFAYVGIGSKVSLANLEDGEIDVSIIYTGENEFYYVYEPYTILVKSLPVKFEGVKAINMLYYDGSLFSIKIYGTNGKALEEDEYVEFVIGKKTYEGYTNSKGIVNFKIPSSVMPGKYTVRIIYDEASTSTNLVVKQILTLKKVNVKKSAKKLILTASLKKVNKKFLKGKTIIFKFNGKKYTAKTNKRGVAKVTIKSSILKKLKTGKKITYQATYYKNTIKNSVKVKK